MDKSICKTQNEVDLLNAVEIMQTNYNNLRDQHNRLLKQVREMAAILKRVADCQRQNFWRNTRGE